jgi:sulfide:quinone oxidoreductase
MKLLSHLVFRVYGKYSILKKEFRRFHLHNMVMKTILILGGGIGGIVTARELRRHLGHGHRIVLIDRHPAYSFAPSYLWLAIGWRQPSAIERQLSLLEHHQIEFHQGTVTHILLKERKVITDRETFDYDYLVIALGAEAIPLVSSEQQNDIVAFNTVSEALRMREKVTCVNGGTIAIAIEAEPYSFPPGPYEAAFLLQSFFAQRNLNNIAVHLFTPEETPLQFLGTSISKIFSKLLAERRIEIHLSHTIASVDKNRKFLSFTNTRTYPYDLLVSIPSYRPPTVVRELDITTVDGWIAINRMMQTSIPNVFALGDSAWLPKENGMRLPMTGVLTLNQAEIVAFNIAHEIQKNSLRKEFTGSGFLIVELGHGRACNIHGDFLSTQTADLVFNEPNVTIHWGKVVIEKYWLWRWF